jgi:penicillin-binding protein 1B
VSGDRDESGVDHLLADLASPAPGGSTRREAAPDVELEDPRPVRPARRPRRWMIALAFFVAFTALGAAAAIPAWARVEAWAAEARALADEHRAHAVAHPGWSFPARVFVPPPDRRAPFAHHLAHARALGYVERCGKDVVLEPGELCERSKQLVPREGDTLEPLFLGWIVGPDAEIREHLPIAEAPQHLLDAIVAAEDREFFEHQGVNVSATVRAAWANLREGGYAQGASTLTMQLVKNLAQRKEKSLERKLREMVMAWAIDRHLGKRGVLEMYLDAPYLGQRGNLSIAGFRAAARHYFGVDAKELDLAQAATLAAILPAPGRFAPDRVPEVARERRDRVLEAMGARMGYDVRAALAAPMTTAPKSELLVERFPAYLHAVRASLEATLDPVTIAGAGLTIQAGMSVFAQAETERLFAEKTAYFQKLLGRKQEEALQSAAVLVDVESGRMLAVWGGTQDASTDFSRALQARRQAGSAFKPLVYAMAFAERGDDGQPRYTAASTMPNVPRTFKTPQGDWRPRNVMNDYSETACLAQGLAWSHNIVTASLLEALGGPKPLKRFAASLGVDTKKYPDEMGLALGQGEVTPYELADFAAMIARDGVRFRPRAVRSAIDAAGKERWPETDLIVGEAVLSPEAATLTRELMRLVVDVGTGGAVRGAGEPGYAGQVAGKTGTTDKERDLWFVGATPRYAGALWLGYDTPSSIGAAAADLSAPLWGWWLGRVAKPDGPLPTFADAVPIKRRGICTITGKVAGPTCKTIWAPFLPGTEPRAPCDRDHSADFPPPDAEAPVYESIWKRMAREKAEAAAAAGAPATP